MEGNGLEYHRLSSKLHHSGCKLHHSGCKLNQRNRVTHTNTPSLPLRCPECFSYLPRLLLPFWPPIFKESGVRLGIPPKESDTLEQCCGTLWLQELWLGHYKGTVAGFFVLIEKDTCRAMSFFCNCSNLYVNYVGLRVNHN